MNSIYYLYLFPGSERAQLVSNLLPQKESLVTTQWAPSVDGVVVPDIPRKLLETGDERWREASYILAVMLERKRILKVKEQIKGENGRVFVYEQPKNGDLLTIPDPNLKMEELEQVQIEVAALLEHGLPVKGEEWPPIPDEPEANAANEEGIPAETEAAS